MSVLRPRHETSYASWNVENHLERDWSLQCVVRGGWVGPKNSLQKQQGLCWSSKQRGLRGIPECKQGSYEAGGKENTQLEEPDHSGRHLWPAINIVSHFLGWVTFPLWPWVSSCLRMIRWFFCLLLQLSDLTISLPFENHVRQGVLLSYLL